MRPKCVCIETWLNFNIDVIYEYKFYITVVEIFYKGDNYSDFNGEIFGSNALKIEEFYQFFSIEKYRDDKIEEILKT